MTDPSRFHQVEALRNGTEAVFRAIRPDDKERMARAFRGLEPETIYKRFFHQKARLTEADLEAATEVDFDSVVALVATLGSGEEEVVIGAGRYLRLAPSPDAPPSAEVSFVVEEDYHGLGIGTRLMRHLTAIAREKGVSRFVAEVLRGNRAMLAVFEKSGMPVEKTPDGDVVHVRLSLDAPSG
jgi:GNAT superfamily N-acetyltransferase